MLFVHIKDIYIYRTSLEEFKQNEQILKEKEEQVRQLLQEKSDLRVILEK